MRWLRANRWYLVALAVLLPGAFLVALNAGYFGYVENRDGRPTTVAGSETVEYAGAQWSLLAWHSFSAETDAGASAALLPGTSLVTATIGVRPGTAPPGTASPGCTVELTDASGTRVWSTAGYSDADFDIAGNAESYCSTSAEGPYQLQVYFVVPDDAVGDMRLRLWDLPSLPELLVFPL